MSSSGYLCYLSKCHMSSSIKHWSLSTSACHAFVSEDGKKHSGILCRNLCMHASCSRDTTQGSAQQQDCARTQSGLAHEPDGQMKCSHTIVASQCIVYKLWAATIFNSTYTYALCAMQDQAKCHSTDHFGFSRLLQKGARGALRNIQDKLLTLVQRWQKLKHERLW